jgi:hypothetical protein
VRQSRVLQILLVSSPGCIAPPSADLPSITRRTQGRSLQLFDLFELTLCHLAHQIENGLLFDFANLNELHDGDSNHRVKCKHPLWVAVPLQPLE